MKTHSTTRQWTCYQTTASANAADTTYKYVCFYRKVRGWVVRVDSSSPKTVSTPKIYDMEIAKKKLQLRCPLP